MSESYLTMDTDLLKQDINTFHIQMETFCQEMEAMRGDQSNYFYVGRTCKPKLCRTDGKGLSADGRDLQGNRGVSALYGRGVQGIYRM